MSDHKTIALYGEGFGFNVKYSELPDGSGMRVTMPGAACQLKWGKSFPDHFVDSLQRFLTDDRIDEIQRMILNPKTADFVQINDA